MRIPAPMTVSSELKTKILEMPVYENGFYDFKVKVNWDVMNTIGTRFIHTRSLDGEIPFHSEAISASVLSKISDGKQMLQGTFFLKKDTILVLEVWQDSNQDMKVLDAEVQLDKLMEKPR
jgi:hypothetical protein